MKMLFLLGVSLCHEYYIKLVEKDLYLQGTEPPEAVPNLDAYDKKNTFTITIPPQGTSQKVINVKEKPGYVLDIADNSNPLIYYPVHGLGNQQFVIVPKDFVTVYYIMNGDLCLTWVEDKNELRIEVCDNLKFQQFEFICADCDASVTGGSGTDFKTTTEGNSEAPTEANTSASTFTNKNINSAIKITSDIESVSVKHDRFLSKDTVQLIKGIGSMVSQISNCFGNNGTCYALDNFDDKLYSYAPFKKSNKVLEMWPDFRKNALKPEELPNDLMGSKYSLDMRKMLREDRESQAHHQNKLHLDDYLGLASAESRIEKKLED